MLIEPLTLLTPTRDRGHLFHLTERWMKRQTMKWSHWIVVDDGKKALEPSLGQQHVRYAGARLSCTFVHAMLFGLSAYRNGRLQLIYDDDWYGAKFLQQTSDVMEEKGTDVVCVVPRSVHHLKKHRYTTECPTTSFSGMLLSETAVGWFRNALTYVYRGKYQVRDHLKVVSDKFWGEVPVDVVSLLFSDQMVGMKGLAKNGRGIDHEDMKGEADPMDSKLNLWVGGSDCYQIKKVAETC